MLLPSQPLSCDLKFWTLTKKQRYKLKQQKLLYIQPLNRPWDESETKILQIPRAMFEVGYHIPAQHEISFLDLNLRTRQRPNWSVEQILAEVLENFQPDLILLSFPTYAQGGQVKKILLAVKELKPRVKVILGGGVLNLIGDAPQKLWCWPVDACYWGNGLQLAELVEAVLTTESSCFLFQPDLEKELKTKLLDGYKAEDFYTSKGRFDFDGYLKEAREVELTPIAFVEMARSCDSFCNYCAFGIEASLRRCRKPGTVLKEIRYLAEKGIDYILIIDPTFGMAKGAADFLLRELAAFHLEHPDVKFDVITRPEYVTEDFVRNLKAAGIVRCGVGMESMSQESLDSLAKTSKPQMVRKAVRNLAAVGIETRLFHMLLPGKFSQETLEFLLQLAHENISFVVQSSFLRPLPNSKSQDQFYTQDRTVFDRQQDTLEQLLEYLLINLTFSSMDLDFEDSELQALIEKTLKEGKNLKTLFSQSREGGKLVLKIGGYAFTESETHAPMEQCITKKQRG